MSARKKDNINLLPEKGFSTTSTGQVLHWLLSSFRIIVIVTEIIVMVAFLSRFWLDARNTDLSEEIEYKQAVLSASSDFEKEYRKSHNKLAVLTDVYRDETWATRYISEIVTYQPEQIFLISFSAKSEKEIEITGTSANLGRIQQFIVNLNSVDTFKKVSLTELRSEPRTTLIVFSITINI
jgi:Tfp pilus assembly protein PilN